MRKWALPLALLTATVYLTLSVSAAACLFAHQSQPRSAHHHTGGVTHSSLCAWACQGNLTVDLPTASLQAQPLQFVAFLLLVGTVVFSFISQQSAQSRAPPRR